MKGSVDYDFSPGDWVYVVLNDNTIHYGKVIQVDIKIYEKDGLYVQDLRFLIAIKALEDRKAIETTEWVFIDEIFSNIDDASDRVKAAFLRSVT